MVGNLAPDYVPSLASASPPVPPLHIAPASDTAPAPDTAPTPDTAPELGEERCTHFTIVHDFEQCLKFSVTQFLL